MQLISLFLEYLFIIRMSFFSNAIDVYTVNIIIIDLMIIIMLLIC